LRISEAESLLPKWDPTNAYKPNLRFDTPSVRIARFITGNAAIGYRQPSPISRLEMTMKICTRVVLSLTVLCLALSPLTFAADDAYLSLVHGIPGRDIGASVDVPVDVLLNNDLCIERQVSFGATLGPLALPAGQYNLKISPADLFVPCGNAAIAETDLTLLANQSVTALAAVDQKGQPTLVTFVNDLGAVAKGQARIVLTNAAVAPVLQVTLQVVNSQQKYTYNVNPGKTVEAEIPADIYTIEVEANGTVLVPAQPLNLYSVSATSVYAVGRASNGSLTLMTKTVRGVI
jgi:hypothetical protein